MEQRMKRNYLNRINTKMSAVVVSVLLLAPQIGVASTSQTQTDAKNYVTENSVDYLITKVIKSAEKSYPLLENDMQAALPYVNRAITSIRGIKEELAKDTHAKAKSPLIIDNSKEYWFIYPKVNSNLFENQSDFPMLTSKFNTGILYHGTKQASKNENKANAYFDYAFAYASLKTARDAIQSNKLREAKIALRWVFEAVYINPEYLISNLDRKMKIDTTINMNGPFPAYSGFNRQAHSPS